MKNEIFNKNGFLSAYGLSCGYIEKRILWNKEIQLYREHSIYHVRYIQTSDGTNRNIIFWQCYEKLAEAKKEFFKQAKKN